MATLGPVLNCNGYNPVTGRCASTSIPSYVPPSAFDSYLSGSYTPQVGTGGVSTPNNTPSAGETFWGDVSSGNIEGALGTLAPLMDSPITGAQSAASGINSVAPGIGQTLSSIGDAISFITDIPRVATTILGLVLIVAGIFALSRGPAVTIVGSAFKEAATS